MTIPEPSAAPEDFPVQPDVAPTAAPSSPGGPFAVEPVDPLVYHKADDSPELRPAAAYVPAAPRLTIRESAPAVPETREHREWVPDAPEESTPPVRQPRVSPGAKDVARSGLFFALMLLPILLIILAVLFGIGLYQQP